MQKLNGIRFVSGLKRALVTALAVTFVGGAANADIVIDSQTIPSADISSITMSPQSGTLFISTTGYTVTKDGSTTPPPADAVVIDTFAADATSVAAGATVILNWATTNASSCDGSGGTGGFAGASIALPFGSVAVTPSAGTNNYTLFCQNFSNGTTATAFVSVTVGTDTTPPPPPPPPPPTPTNCPTPPLNGGSIDWTAFWGGSGFPDSSAAGDDAVLEIGSAGYTAISFNTGNFAGFGGFLLIETTLSDGIRFGTISECPGDFNVAPLCRHVWGLGGGIIWSTVNTPGTCLLDANKTYFLNFTYTNGVDPSTSSCDSANGGSCVVRIQSTAIPQ